MRLLVASLASISAHVAAAKLVTSGGGPVAAVATPPLPLLRREGAAEATPAKAVGAKPTAVISKPSQSGFGAGLAEKPSLVAALRAVALAGPPSAKVPGPSASAEPGSLAVTSQKEAATAQMKTSHARTTGSHKQLGASADDAPDAAVGDTNAANATAQANKDATVAAEEAQADGQDAVGSERSNASNATNEGNTSSNLSDITNAFARIGDQLSNRSKYDIVSPTKRSLPQWAQAHSLYAGMFHLPYQPNCKLLLTRSDGYSDYGLRQTVCEACKDNCTAENKQLPAQLSWKMKPTLVQIPAEDIIVHVQMRSILQIKPYSLNGIHPRTTFTITSSHTGFGKHFHGEMGAKVRGGSAANGILEGQHVFQIMDSKMPSAQWKGTWKALPGAGKPGRIGTCRRHCINCEDRPQWIEEGLSTGTICTASVLLTENHEFVYRLRKAAPIAEAHYDAHTYMGSEWEVVVTEPVSGNLYVLGSIIVEGSGHASGLTAVGAVNEHLGCAPCDAYYQAVRFTGPFIMHPRGVHQVVHAAVKRPPSFGRTCFMSRAVGLGGLGVLLESGPGVWPAYLDREPPPSVHDGDEIYRCPTSTQASDASVILTYAGEDNVTLAKEAQEEGENETASEGEDGEDDGDEAEDTDATTLAPIRLQVALR